MSVLIRGMIMPNNCWECPCFREDRVCNFDDEYREVYDGRPDWCPLVELLEKHGDLIDRDELIDDLKYDVTMGEGKYI